VGGCLAVLALAAGGNATTGGTRVTGHGISAVAPAGWHLSLSRGTLVASTAPLPADGRWIATRPSNSLRRAGLVAVMFEDGRSPHQPFDVGFFRRGAPRPFTARDFGLAPLGGSSPRGHSYARRNFTVAGRFFDLFVESGTPRPSTVDLRSLDELVASLHVAPGDYYPGTVAAASFHHARGWFTVASARTPVGPETSTTTVASSIRFRDGLNEFPPHRTIAQLPADGIVIVVQLVASNRDPPLGSGTRGHGVGVARCGSFEGVPSAVAVCGLTGIVNRQYTISGWVVYGRTDPTQAMRSRVHDELARLVLPHWPTW
jgi:hypothetical protein